MAKSLGRQALAEFFNCSSQILDDRESLEHIMIKSAEAAGAFPVKSLFHKFSPHGVTGVVIISESHLSIHTWPEYSYAAVDIFTCGNTIDNIRAMEYIKDKLSSGYYSIMEISRGILNIEENKLR